MLDGQFQERFPQLRKMYGAVRGPSLSSRQIAVPSHAGVFRHRSLVQLSAVCGAKANSISVNTKFDRPLDSCPKSLLML